MNKYIKLYKEQVEENRREIRYKMDLPGTIESLLFDGKSYPLHTMIDVRVVNISKSGMRIITKESALHAENKFTVHIKIGENDKRLTGEVVNFRDTPPDKTEYGCRLIN
jgi:hypothetical protein